MKTTMHLKCTLLLSFVLFSLNLGIAGDILKGWIIKNDGTRMDKYIEFFVAGETDIVCYDTADKKNKVKYKSEELKEIALIIEADKDTTIFHKTKIAKYSMLGKLKVQDGLYWATLTHHTEKVEAYEVYYDDPDYRNNMVGYIVAFQHVVAAQCSKFPENDFIVYHTQIDNTSDPFHALDKMIRKTFDKLTKTKCPAMKDKIEEKKYKVEQFKEMLDDYTALCK